MSDYEDLWSLYKADPNNLGLKLRVRRASILRGDVWLERAPFDRPEWGPGPWDNEADFVLWLDRGYMCMIRRNFSPEWGTGALCGYVRVPTDNPAHDKALDYGEFDLDVHGGITWAEHATSHWRHEWPFVDCGFWAGFDCSHAFDFMPMYTTEFLGNQQPTEDTPYRDMEFVEREIVSLVDQLEALK